ncbi:hypothetical protein C8R42DRAFT_724505 [Lentinula raphanica]|nr:hypothetical protein C8R42DRAFT_724505 [Lentinula raphanica]
MAASRLSQSGAKYVEHSLDYSPPQLDITTTPPTRMFIESVIQEIQHETLQLQSFLFSKIPTFSRVESFAFDVALVALSIRTGHLIDAFSPKDPCKGISTLLHRLKQKKSQLFHNIVHIYEPCSEQSFFINASLLLAKYPPKLDGSNGSESEWRGWPYPGPVFVSTNDPPTILSTSPDGLFAILQNIIQQIIDPSTNLTETLILPQGLPAALTVPLAAILLEYSVAYCPSSDIVAPFPGGVTLDVYEVILKLPMLLSTRDPRSSTNLDEERPHRILKFSCPSSLVLSSPELTHQTMEERLKSYFDRRLRDALHGNLALVSVRHTIENLDTIAL